MPTRDTDPGHGLKTLFQMGGPSSESFGHLAWAGTIGKPPCDMRMPGGGVAGREGRS